MAIFQKSVIKKYLKSLDKDILEKAYQKFKENYSPHKIEKIKQLKEEEYQDGFLRDLFVDVFGYILKPDVNYNLVREYKNHNDGRKADGAILRTEADTVEKAIAVIELKSTKTKDLKKVTEQAFGYKNNQPECKYVIISNFQKLRFYVDYANEFEEFDLFNLQKNDFDLLYLLLNKNSIFSDIPLKLKAETKFHVQNISDKLYKDYSNFKNKLFKNLIKNNPEQDKLILFKKSQKLLDRFLFILFAEDSGLLPPNSISRIIERYRKLIELDAYKPIYNIYKQYFGYMNISRKGKTNADNIPAYNGGLFYTDKLLDNLKIDDEVLINDLLKLSEYDFNTEVDVNILGHIFEHSLSEIEEITAEIQGSSIDKTKSKRKKDGVFYTPKYITQYIVENTIGKLCTEKRKELDIEEIEFDGSYRLKGGNLSVKGKNLYQKLNEYKKWLLSLKIVDPACGSGAFLNQALKFLIQEHKDIDDIIAELTNTSLRIFDTDKAILENNLYGVDINEESVEIAKLSLWLRTARKNRKLSNLNKNIKCGNSLIDDPEIAGDKAFDWNKEFPQVFKEKNKKAWHITTATHNSRYSQRMFDNHIKLGESVWISEKDEIILAETIAGIVKDDNLNIIAANICGDHLHLLLVCEDEEMPKIVGKIKAVTARTYNIENGITVPAAGGSSSTTAATREHVPLSTYSESSENAVASPEMDSSEKAKKKKKYNSLWTQKFGKSKITDDEYLYNAIKYIRNNRKKHQLPENKKLISIFDEMCCTKEHAFRKEYNGGFDVVIGNPPYVQVNEFQEYYLRNFKTASCGDLYAYFIEKGILLLRKNGLFSFITPSLFIKGIRYESLREFLLKKTNVIEILDKGDGVFQDVQMPTAIITIKNNNNKKQKWDEFIPGFNIISKIENISLIVSDFSKIKRGLEIGKDKVFKKGRGIEILTGENISRYFIKNKCFISNETYLKFKKDEYFFSGKRIVIRETGNRLTSVFVNEDIQQNRSLYSIKILDEKISYYFLLLLLNSKLIQYYYKTKFAANTGVFPKIRIAQVKNIPIKEIPIESQQPFIEKADKMLELNKELHKKKTKFIDLLKANLDCKISKNKKNNTNSKPDNNGDNSAEIKSYGNNNNNGDSSAVIESYENNNNGVNPVGNNNGENSVGNNNGENPVVNNSGVTPAVIKAEPCLKITKKLDSFYEYDFKTFLAELKKQKIKLSLSEQAEWKDFFDDYKANINNLQNEINKTDNEIDRMVYKLYELTDEEIEIVEKNI